MTIGKRIRKLRKAAGMSQEELADKIGKTRTAISKYESDSILPSMKALEDLASALKVSAFDLLDDTDSPEYEFSTFTDDELELIRLYRRIPNFGKRHVLYLARNIYEEFSTEDDIESVTIYGGKE